MLEPVEWAAVVVVCVVLGVVLALLGAPAWASTVGLVAVGLGVLEVQRRRR